MQLANRIRNVCVLGDNLRSEKIAKFLSEYLQVDRIDRAMHLSHGAAAKKKVTNNIFSQYDICILAGWSSLISLEELEMPTFGFLTCHAGCLPEFRGSSPLGWAILDGADTFSISVIQTNENFDEGCIFESAKFDLLDTYNIKDLHQIACDNFPTLVLSAIAKLELGVRPTKQVKAGARYFPRRDKLDAIVRFKRQSSDYISKLFRAVSPLYDPPFFIHRNNWYAILDVQIDPIHRGNAGRVYKIKGDWMLVSCAEHSVWLKLESTEAFTVYDVLE